MSDIKEQPTPGHRYKVKAGDRITFISTRAYGTDQHAKKIVQANNAMLSGRVISGEGLPVIRPGDILIIPAIKERKPIQKTLSGKDKNDFTLVLGSRELKVTSGSLIQTMNHAADGWTASIPWTPGDDKELDKLLLPFKFPDAKIYIGGVLQNTGRLYTVSPSLTPTGRVKKLVGYSNTIDLVDSTVNPPFEKNKSTLEQIASDVLFGTGIRAVFKVETGGPFDRATAGDQESKFAYLSKLAAQRGIIVSNTDDGDLLFQIAQTTGQSVGTLAEGKPPVLSWSAQYDGRKLFRLYRATGKSPGGDAQTATAIDENIPESRNTTFTANETTPGDIKKAAEWQRSRRYAEALKIPIPVSGWYAPNGNLWKPNTLVTIISPSIDLPDGFTFLIEQVEKTFATSGNTTNLKVVPPQVYTRSAVGYPWGLS